MSKPRKPKPGESAERQEGGRPAAAPADAGLREDSDAEALDADLDGAGDGKRMPDHLDDP